MVAMVGGVNPDNIKYDCYELVQSIQYTTQYTKTTNKTEGRIENINEDSEFI